MSRIRVRPSVYVWERECACACACVSCMTLLIRKYRDATYESFHWKCYTLQIHQIQANSSVQIQMKSRSQFEFVPRDTEESEFLDLVGFGGDTFSVETVIWQDWCFIACIAAHMKESSSWHDSFICVMFVTGLMFHLNASQHKWRSHICDITHLYVW